MFWPCLLLTNLVGPSMLCVPTAPPLPTVAELSPAASVSDEYSQDWPADSVAGSHSQIGYEATVVRTGGGRGPGVRVEGQEGGGGQGSGIAW